jgi:filamentous hemagglutinin
MPLRWALGQENNARTFIQDGAAGIALYGAVRVAGFAFGRTTPAVNSLPRIPTTVKGIVDSPGSIYGRSANEIAEAFTEQGFGAAVRQSTRGSQRAIIVNIDGHSEIGQIQVHPGAGRHVGPYVKISTSTSGTIKVVGPGYKAASGEKARIIWMGE